MMISYGKQNINQEDVKAILEVLQSDFLTQGPAIENFERDVAQYCGVKYSVAVTNATSALHIACLSAGLKSGDILWTSPNTFVASANCARYCGANVDFVDIDAQTYNMSVQELANQLEKATLKPKVVIPVHFAGQSCEMARIQQLAEKYNFMVIEDASHCIGGEYKDTKIGSCQYSDMVVFSFHPVKIVTTGEGGMVLTNNKMLYDRLILYRNHGITRDLARMGNEPDGSWYYEQIDLGYNYRMTDIQAALGVSQMKRIDEFVSRRRHLAERYHSLLKNLPLQLPQQIINTKSAWHLYVVRYDFAHSNLAKQKLFEKMKEKGIKLNLHYIPLHLQPYYQKLGFKQGDFPISEHYYHDVFTLPLYYDLTDEEQDYIVACLAEVLKDVK